MAQTPEQKAAAKAARDAAKAAATATPAATPEGVPAVTPDSARQARWEAYLDGARKQRVEWHTEDIFDAQRARGEFDTIPEDFK